VKAGNDWEVVVSKEYPLEIRIIFSVCVILAIVSLTGIGSEIHSPDEWLLAWTSWVSTVVFTVVAARVLWVGGVAFKDYLDRH
jgi:hypothetical protein